MDISQCNNNNNNNSFCSLMVGNNRVFCWFFAILVTLIDSSSSSDTAQNAYQVGAGVADGTERALRSYSYRHHSRPKRVVPPATSIPRFRKYAVDDFNFLKVLGKGSFGKVREQCAPCISSK